MMHVSAVKLLSHLMFVTTENSLIRHIMCDFLKKDKTGFLSFYLKDTELLNIGQSN